jgi:hypothetical protein
LFYICKLHYFDVLSNTSFKEHLPEDGHNRWPKHVAGYAVYSTINLHICALAKRDVRKRQRLSWDKFVTNLEHDTYRTQPKVYKILKQISKDVKETARIQGNIGENTFLQYHRKLWNTTNINELQLEYNSTDYSHAFITLDELEKAFKLTKNGKTPAQDNINSELYKYAPEDFKLRLLQHIQRKSHSK